MWLASGNSCIPGTACRTVKISSVTCHRWGSETLRCLESPWLAVLSMHCRVIWVLFASGPQTPSHWAVILVFLLLFLHSRLNYNNYLLRKFWHNEHCLNLLIPVVNNKAQNVPAFLKQEPRAFAWFIYFCPCSHNQSIAMFRLTSLKSMQQNKICAHAAIMLPLRPVSFVCFTVCSNTCNMCGCVCCLFVGEELDPRGGRFHWDAQGARGHCGGRGGRNPHLHMNLKLLREKWGKR